MSESQSQSQTELSQSELEEIVSPRFIEKSLGPGTLSTRLQTIASVLPRIDQEDDDRITELHPLVNELGKPWILKQKNNQIQLLLACIHSDILRIYAPEQPYSDDNTLSKIFELMIASLDGVENPKHEDYDFHFRVLESLSTVQSYIVMNDLENESLLMFLTKQLFKITTENTVKLSLNHITDILCGLINDLQVIPETFLQFILKRLIEPSRSQHPTEYDLSSTVIRRCTNDLKLAIDEYIANTIANINHLTDDDTKKNKEEKRKEYRIKLCIIAELASISVDFLENSMLHLEESLQNEDLQIRLLFVDMFASIFTQSSPALSRQWTPLFRVFLKRYDDVSIQIREFMANITCLLFQTQHVFVKEIQEFCIKRIEDVNERIRTEITKQVCIASIQSSSNTPTSIISLPLFNKLLQRTLDKKQSVRYIAIQYSSKLFAQHLCPYWRNNKSLPSEMRALLPIPKKLIFILNSIDFNTKLHLESIFDKEMIGNHLFISSNKKDFDSQKEIEKRMNVTLGIIALLPDESKKLWRKYFMREKYQLQILIQNIINIYNERAILNIAIDDDNDVKALQRQYEISYSNFNQRFPMNQKGSQKPSDLLKQLIENKNGKIRHYLQCLCSTSSKLKSIYNCSSNLLSLEKNEFTAALCVRLSNVMFSCDAISLLLNKMVDIVVDHNGQPMALLNSGIFILNCLCDEIPDIFDDHQCLQQLIKLFNFPKTIAPSVTSSDIIHKLSFVSLRILAKCITPNSFDDDDFLSDLTEKARATASYQEAQLATQCLVKSQGKYSQIVKTLCYETSKELDITEQYLPSLLSTLGIIAKLSPNIFIKRAHHITHFILDTLLPYHLDQNDGIYKENNIEKIKSKTETMTPILFTSKQCGIQILVNYLLSIVDIDCDELGIKSVGISPIKSNPSPMDMDDITLEHNNEIVMEEPDPFSNDNENTLQQPISPEIECDRILDAMFELIRKYAQTNRNEIEQHKTTRKYCRSPDTEKVKQSKPRPMSNDEVLLVNMTVDGILDIIGSPRYRRLLGLLRFYELGFLIHHKNAAIRKHILQSFWNRLRDHKLPTHYSCIFPLIATDPNKKLRDRYRPAVQKYFDRMRKENQIRASSATSLNPIQISKLPEYLLFYVVHLLAHHPDFDEKLAKRELKEAEFSYKRRRRMNKSSDSEDTSPSRMIKSVNETSCDEYFGSIFDFYFDALLKGSESNKFPLIIKIMTKMDESFDVFKPLSRGHRYLIRIAMKKLKKRYKNKSFQDFPGRVPLPKIIFKLRESHDSASSIGADTTSPRRITSLMVTTASDESTKEDDVMNAIRRNLNETLIDKNNKVISSGSGADADDDDDEVNRPKRNTKKRKREDMVKDTGDSPPKKKHKRRVMRKKKS